MNQRRLILFLLLAALSSASLYAEENDQMLCYKISYYGNNFWNPGFSVGLEYPKSTKEKTDRKGREFLFRNAFSLDLAFYSDPGSHAAILLHSGLNLRMIREDKLDLAAGISPLGIYRSFLPDTFKVSDEGVVTRVHLPGRIYYAPTLTFGIGNPLPKIPLEAWFMEIEVTSLVPYNTYAMFLLNVKLGVKL